MNILVEAFEAGSEIYDMIYQLREDCTNVMMEFSDRVNEDDESWSLEDEKRTVLNTMNDLLGKFDTVKDKLDEMIEQKSKELQKNQSVD